MTRRETLLSSSFLFGISSLLLGTESGRAFLSEAVGILGWSAPRWLAWGLAWLGYGVSFLLRSRLIRIALQFTLAHVVLQLRSVDPVFWTLVKEACLLALVALVDFYSVGMADGGPRTPRGSARATKLQRGALQLLDAVSERRRGSRRWAR